MKKLLSISLAAGVAFTLTACTGNSAAPSVTMMDAAKADERKMCSVEVNGIDKVIATASAYNKVAQKEGVEYRRLGINNSSAIAAVKEGIKTGAKTVKPKDVKGKTKQKFDINYAAERACKFAIGALRQKAEAPSLYRDAIPGDGFKY